MRSYAVITPVRDEAENLPRLAASLAAQTELPRTWVIVDNGSEDGTRRARARARCRAFAGSGVLSIPGASQPSAARRSSARCTPRSTTCAADPPDFAVNVDADISIEPDYFARLLDRFDADPSLGIASGSALRAPGRQSGGSATSRARRSGARRGRSAGRACRRSCRSRSVSRGTASTSSRPTPVAGGRRRSRTCRFKHHRREGERDGRRGAPAATRVTRRTTSAIARGISSCARSSTRAASRPRSG